MMSYCTNVQAWYLNVKTYRHGLILYKYSNMMSYCTNVKTWCHIVQMYRHVVRLYKCTDMMSYCTHVQTWCHTVQMYTHDSLLPLNRRWQMITGWPNSVGPRFCPQSPSGRPDIGQENYQKHSQGQDFCQGQNFCQGQDFCQVQNICHLQNICQAQNICQIRDCVIVWLTGIMPNSVFKLKFKLKSAVEFNKNFIDLLLAYLRLLKYAI